MWIYPRKGLPMSEKINAGIGVPAVLAQIGFPGYWPDLDASADMATKLIPIFGAISGAILAANWTVTLLRNIRAAREERLEREHHDA